MSPMPRAFSLFTDFFADPVNRAAYLAQQEPAATVHTIRVHHTDSAPSSFEQRVSLLEVIANDPREPIPPREIAWGHLERYGLPGAGGYEDRHVSPVACTLGVRYPGGLASCLRAWGCKVVRVLATSSDRDDAAALEREIATVAA